MICPSVVIEATAVPWDGPVTKTAVGVFSKLSALAPSVPVIALYVMGAFSAVVTVSATMSAIGVIAMGTVSVLVAVPAVPVKVSVSAPL